MKSTAPRLLAFEESYGSLKIWAKNILPKTRFRLYLPKYGLHGNEGMQEVEP